MYELIFTNLTSGIKIQEWWLRLMLRSVSRIWIAMKIIRLTK